MVGRLVCDNVYCPTPRETRKRRDGASAPSIIDPVNSFSSDDVSCVQENEESEENHSNGHVAATIIPLLSHSNAVMPCMVTTPQHDSDDESSDDDLADSHEDSTEGEEKMRGGGICCTVTC